MNHHHHHHLYGVIAIIISSSSKSVFIQFAAAFDSMEPPYDNVIADPPPKDYYKVLGVEYDSPDESIRLNYRMLALKWHPDKHKGDTTATVKFQEISEAYSVLSDHVKRFHYDLTGIYEIEKYTLREYLARFQGMILTTNGLGIDQKSTWSQQVTYGDKLGEE